MANFWLDKVVNVMEYNRIEKKAYAGNGISRTDIRTSDPFPVTVRSEIETGFKYQAAGGINDDKSANSGGR